MTMPSPAFPCLSIIGWNALEEDSILSCGTSRERRPWALPMTSHWFIFHLAAVARGSMSLKPGARSSFMSPT